MIKLGHIEYSNCFPVHAQLVSARAPDGIEILAGTPSRLNRALEAGEIDVAPASSIEYARHTDSYRLLPDFVIGSDGKVGSILFESTRPIAELNDSMISVPTASATSVVLLKILLALKYGVRARFQWFSQEHAIAPADADATLWIGDVALRRTFSPERTVYDLGGEWKDWTGLPFVFAAWQTSASPAANSELRRLTALLHESRAWFLANADKLAQVNAERFGLDAQRLLTYWQSLRYSFDDPMKRGLLRYYELAAQMGEAPPVTELRWV